MKQILALAATALALSVGTQAFAADLPPSPTPYRAPAIYAPPPAFTWSGFYIGVNGGYGWGKWDDGSGDSFSSNGGLAGGTIGANYQVNQFVVGVEGDFDWSGMKWDQSLPITTGLGGPINGTATANYKNEWLGTFAARFGVAVDRTLFYVKGGGAVTNEKYSMSVTDVPSGVTFGESDSFTRWGWMVGGGIEYAVTNNVSLKAEYNYIDFGSNNETLNFSSSASPAVIGISDTAKLNVSAVKVGINVLFH